MMQPSGTRKVVPYRGAAMTKRRQKTISAGDPTDSRFEELGVVVHATSAVTDHAIYMALIEQLFEIEGPTAIASLLAELLRDPSPHREVLDIVARWLDPQGDDCFRLVVERRRCGKRWTKYVNDAAINKAVSEVQQELIDAGKPKHGSKGRAVRKVAKRFEISQIKVRKAIAEK